ncbi:hypothetical protein CPC08DRAFT_731735, partial [Agrocybe pediades]
IWRHTKLSTQSRKRYRIIVNALIESSAIYTATVLFLAITDFASTGKIESSFTVSLISIFAQAASQVISGLAPTLMIARLVVSTSQEATEVSSVPLPFDRISRASLSTNDNAANESSTDVEMQHGGSIGVGKQDDEEIQAGSTPYVNAVVHIWIYAFPTSIFAIASVVGVEYASARPQSFPNHNHIHHS